MAGVPTRLLGNPAGQPGVHITTHIAASQQEVVVTEAAPLIDLTTTQVGHDVTAEEFDRMPKSRTFQSLVTSAPTVTQGDLEGGIQVNGASAGENNFVVDGITTSSVLQGKLSVENGWLDGLLAAWRVAITHRRHHTVSTCQVG